MVRLGKLSCNKCLISLLFRGKQCNCQLYLKTSNKVFLIEGKFYELQRYHYD